MISYVLSAVLVSPDWKLLQTPDSVEKTWKLCSYEKRENRLHEMGFFVFGLTK